MISQSQRQVLREWYQTNMYPNKEEVHRVAMSLNIKKETVQNWVYQMHRKKAAERRLSQSE